MITANHDPAVAAKRIAIAEAAAARYGFPARLLSFIGVTGTNGKTTTVNILRGLLHTASAPSASIGTLGVLIGRDGEVVPGGLGLTTPGPEELHRVLRDLVDRGVRTVAMEVSSHALDQHRVHGIRFEAGVFTNLTRDHLDYHGSMDEYLGAKALLIGYLSEDGTAVVNVEQPEWRALPPAPRTVTFGMGRGDVRAVNVEFDSGGSRWLLTFGGNAAHVRLPLLGDFNVANALAAAAAALATGHQLARVAEALCAIPQVPGRLEMISTVPPVLRDYAHTPDALARSLAALRPFVAGRLIVVFGAGGDRDPGKRPLMGSVAESGADWVIVTSDNPRTEDPELIIDEIERGMSRSHERISNRHDAIARAIEMVAPGDVVLLAGKGHETYQVIGTEKYPFDEKEVVARILERVR